MASPVARTRSRREIKIRRNGKKDSADERKSATGREANKRGKARRACQLERTAIRSKFPSRVSDFIYRKSGSNRKKKFMCAYARAHTCVCVCVCSHCDVRKYACVKEQARLLG